MSTDQSSEFTRRTHQQHYITRSRKGSVHEHTPRRTRNTVMFNVNNNVTLRFDMRTKNRGKITTHEDDDEKYSSQEHNNRGLKDCVEPISDKNLLSNNMVGYGTPPEISHRISQSCGGSHLNFRSSISSTTYGKPHGSECGYKWRMAQLELIAILGG